MPYCPKCRCEYRVGFEKCTDCDVSLVGELSPEGPAKNKDDQAPEGFHHFKGKIICLRQYIQSFQAEVDRSVLEANGIDCYIAAQSHWGAGALTLTEMGSRLMIKEEDKEKALKILEKPNE